jgi:hypothetical protein
MVIAMNRLSAGPPEEILAALFIFTVADTFGCFTAPATEFNQRILQV